MSICFEYQSLARRAGLSTEALGELESCVRRQYGSDEMMIELRLMRTLQAILEGAATFDDALREFRADKVDQTGARRFRREHVREL